MSACSLRTRRALGADAARTIGACVALLIALASPALLHAQEPAPPTLLRFETTPIGALPPMALPMPASRNHNYWGARVQVGHRSGRAGASLTSIAGGIDLQWRGGSIFGVTVGHQEADCEPPADCKGHTIYGLRGRFNVITGGPTIGAILGDYSATSTLGAEIGFGYAPDIGAEANACTFDLGMPLSLAMLQRVRLVAFAKPSIVWDVNCGNNTAPQLEAWLMSVGMGVQQIGLRGLDVYLGLQTAFRDDTGYLFGISVTYVRLP